RDLDVRGLECARQLSMVSCVGVSRCCPGLRRRGQTRAATEQTVLTDKRIQISDHEGLLCTVHRRFVFMFDENPFPMRPQNKFERTRSNEYRRNNPATTPHLPRTQSTPRWG
ncbi:unnamed protein product, partial [Scytosiphon promiscuus]